jgi:hypothetical protein
MSDQSSIDLTPGPPETVLPPADPELVAGLAELAGRPSAARLAGTEVLAARFPRAPEGWAALTELADRDVERYAFARVGYHRGLDALRAAGWRGNGYVRWRHESNRGFLRSLDALRAAAEAIGEEDEATRCALFLRQLDPDWDREEHA